MTTEFYPRFNEDGLYEGDDRCLINKIRGRWWISSDDPEGDMWLEWTLDHGELGFARKIDCEIAIKSLSEAGVTTVEDLMKLDDHQFKKITCQKLLW